MKNNKNGISLIVLVITIIVMIILAASVVITLSNTGIINKANDATYETELKQIQTLASLAWSDAYTAKMTDSTINIEEEVKLALERQGIARDKYIMDVSETGVVISAYTKDGTIKATTISGQLPLSLNSSAGVKLDNYKIYGNSIQNGIPSPVTPIEIQSVGVKTNNLFNKSDTPIYRNNNSMVVEETRAGIKFTNPAISSQGPYIANVYAIDSVENIGKNTIYISADVKISGIPQVLIILGYCDENGENRTTVKHLYIKEDGQYTTSMDVEPEKYAGKQIAVWLYSIACPSEVTLDAGTSVEYSNIMLSIGENEYEPYGYRIPVKVSNNTDEIVTNIYLDEPLRKIGDYADYIDFENKKVVRKIAAKIFDGTETIYDISTGTYRYTYYVLGNDGAVTNDICLSTHFTHQADFSYTRPGNNMFRVYNSPSAFQTRIGFRFYLDGTIINDTTAVKKLLKDYYNQGNPVIMYYAHANGLETVEPVDLPNISTVKGNATLTVIDTITPSKVELTYKEIK